jgi:hypothetical protein
MVSDGAERGSDAGPRSAVGNVFHSGAKTPSKQHNPFCALCAMSGGPAVSAPTENRSEVCVVSILDWVCSKRSIAQATKLEQLVQALNEIVAEGALPAF